MSDRKRVLFMASIVVIWVLFAVGNPLMDQTRSQSAAAQPVLTLDPAVRSAGANESWWRTVCEQIQQEEYDASVSAQGLQAPNRAQNLRTYFRNERIEVVPRTNKGEDPWRFTWRTTRWGRPENLQAVNPPAVQPCFEGPRVTYRRAGFAEWYENTKEGLKQGFTVGERLEGHGPLSIHGILGDGLRAEHCTEADAVDLLDEHGARVLTYGALHVWDAKGEEMPSRLVLEDNEVALVIDDKEAAYPLTIDPLLTSPSWTAESNQVAAYFGYSVGTAGDVNGDGYGDVVVGAHEYDNGETNEGRAFVFYGNDGGGLHRIPRQARWDDSAPIALLGESDSESAFRLKAHGRTPAGRGKVYLQCEVKPIGAPFDGTGLVIGPATDTGTPVGGGSTVPLSELVTGLTPSTLYHWRMRIASDSPFFPHSPWLWLPCNGVTEADLRTHAPYVQSRVCCINGDCSLIDHQTCLDLGGDWHPAWETCDPNPCLPPSGGCIRNIVDLTPYFDWGAVSSYPGLIPPGNMGIVSPAHGYQGFYFPSDSLAPFAFYPKAWLTPGIHLATRYGPANVRLHDCPVPDAMVTVPDRNGVPCSLYIRVPSLDRIDQTTDLNAMQVSSGEAKTVSINDTLQTLVFLANCDGYVESPDSPSPSQPLKVRLNYQDGAADSVLINDIHPAGRLDIVYPTFPPSWIFVYGNEVLVCDPVYFDDQVIDPYHSEAWHWYAVYPDSYKLAAPPGRDWADHDVGNCVLTVTDQGIIGFMDDTQSEGSGFIYPAGGSNHLYLGSLWVGESEDYVANRDYGPEPVKEWVVSSDPPGRISEDSSGWISGSADSDQDFSASYTDAGATQPRGLFVDQESWAYAAPDPADDIVIINYRVRNDGASAIESLYVGCFLDFDIGDAYDDDTGSTDQARALVHMTDASGIHVGASLLQDASGQEPPLGNLTLISNGMCDPYYIYDETKYRLLSAAGPVYVLPDAPSPGDDRVLASAGPIVLEADEDTLIAFAIMGGESLGKLQANADAATLILQQGITDAPRHPTPEITRLLPAKPNPFSWSTNLIFELPREEDVRLLLYDVTGREVRHLLQGRRSAGRHVVTWDGRDGAGRRVANGVYFVRLAAGDARQSRQIVLAR